jgi:hypothetical protein
MNGLLKLFGKPNIGTTNGSLRGGVRIGAHWPWRKVECADERSPGGWAAGTHHTYKHAGWLERVEIETALPRSYASMDGRRKESVHRRDRRLGATTRCRKAHAGQRRTRRMFTTEEAREGS